MNELKEMFSNKNFLCDLVKNHIDEFRGMKHEEIMNCFVGEIQVDKKPVYLPFYDGDEELNYGIYFKMISPKLNYYHEIICAIEIRHEAEPLKPHELPACAGLSLLLMLQAQEENKDRDIAEKCYGFYFYTEAPNYLENTSNRFNVHIRSNNQNFLENDSCTGIEIYLGED